MTNNELIVNINKTCAVTGHRRIEKKFNFQSLINTFYTLIDGGYDTFLIGMAVGFDTLCFNILQDIKKQKDIKIIACVPCLDQAEKFNLSQKKEYERMLNIADQKICLYNEYNDKCMLERNRLMVDNCSMLVAYCTRDFGGTAYTVRYAQKNNVPIKFVGDIK